VGGAFNLPAEQLIAQISADAERAAREPESFRHLLSALTQAASLADAARQDGTAADVASRLLPRWTSCRSAWPGGGGTTCR
jgi:hypothetical protein